MIELPFNAPAPSSTRLAVIGLGSAGSNVLDRLVLDGLAGAQLVAVNTDVQGLSGSVAPTKIQIGRGRTHGLGAGGDPEVGQAAAEENAGDVMSAVGDANAIVFLVGLGGGTGSGALALLVEAARARDAHVIVVATLPFGFEGARRRAQALEALASVDGLADLLICFENDRMSELVSAKTGIREAFAHVDEILADAIRGLGTLSRGRGLLNAGLAEVSATFNGEGLRALFGAGEASGDNRAHQAVEAALKSPLLDRGRALKDAESVVVHLAGGTDLTLHETQIAMSEVRRQLPEDANVFCGLVVDPALGENLRVTLLASTYVEVAEPAAAAGPAPMRLGPPVSRARLAARVEPPAPKATPRRAPSAEPAEEPFELTVEMPAAAEPADESVHAEVAAGHDEEHLPVDELTEDELEEEELEEAAEEEPVAEYEPEAEPEPEPAPAPAAPANRPRMRPLFAPMQNTRRTPAPAPTPAAAQKLREEKQEQMQFEPVHRGRFEKSEPTIIDGQNLDVPTFMRRNVRVE